MANLTVTKETRIIIPPLIYACFESVVKHLHPGRELALPNRLDVAQRQDDGSWKRCWVYHQPESHPEVNIFAKPEVEVYNAWLAGVSSSGDGANEALQCAKC